MKKILLLTTFAFILGFLTHALFFPDFLANGITDVSQIVIPNTSPTPKPEGPRSLITKIYYDGEHFNRHNIVIEVGTYLMIANSSHDKLMWLTSNNNLFVTQRGYAESEAVQERIDTRGQFAVADKNNPQERLVVTVK